MPRWSVMVPEPYEHAGNGWDTPNHDRGQNQTATPIRTVQRPQCLTVEC